MKIINRSPKILDKFLRKRLVSFKNFSKNEAALLAIGKNLILLLWNEVCLLAHYVRGPEARYQLNKLFEYFDIEGSFYPMGGSTGKKTDNNEQIDKSSPPSASILGKPKTTTINIDSILRDIFGTRSEQSKESKNVKAFLLKLQKYFCESIINPKSSEKIQSLDYALENLKGALYCLAGEERASDYMGYNYSWYDAHWGLDLSRGMTWMTWGMIFIGVSVSCEV